MTDQPDYWQMTNKELIVICKQLNIPKWSGKRKKDLIAMIKATFPAPEPNPQPEPQPNPQPVSPLPPRPSSPEPYEMLDALLMEHAMRVLASLPKSPVSEFDDHLYL